MSRKEGAAKSAAKKHGMSVDEWREHHAVSAWCYLCQRWLPKSDFNKDASRTTGLMSTCRECTSYKSTASRYGIAIDLARQLRQGTLPCDICGEPGVLEVDHQHGTTNVRGYLCGSCNKGLGMFKDDLGLMRKGIEYLEARNG